MVSLFAFIGGANAEVRTLKIYHLHTHEKAEIAYKKDGRYLPDGLRKLNYILRDWRRNETVKIDPRLLDLLWAVYRKTGSHDYINVICGYRAPETNAMLRKRTSGVAKKSQHTRGKAIDFFIPGVPLRKLREIGLKTEVGGVGYYPNSGSPFVHLDVGNPRYWPRMSRRQLLALFPHGKTLYVPSDGKPLARYDEALVAYKARNERPSGIEVASASGKHKGFFATLFGGGADQEEDEADIKVASSQAAQARATSKKPAAATNLPGVELAKVGEGSASGREPEKPGAIIAALPSRAVPLPLAAPRPEVDVGPAVAQNAVETGAEEPQIALNIPLPTHRPDYSPPAGVREVASLRPDNSTHNDAKAVHATNADQLAALLAGQAARPGDGDAVQADARPIPTLAAFTGQLPSARPAIETNTASIAMLPKAPPPRYEPRDLDAAPAVFRTEDKSGKGDRLVQAASPRLALLERPAGVSASEAIASGVRTARKHARSASNAERPQPKSFEVPIHSEIVRWAVQRRSFNPAIASGAAPSLATDIVRSTPKMVYTNGFQRHGPAQNASRFSGNAVTFLPVARFGTN